MTAPVWLHSTLVSSVVFTLGCSDSFGTVPASGTFVLRQVQQDLLPTVLAQNEFFVIRVLSDTIHLAPDGTGTISGVREFVPLQGGTGDGPVHIETPCITESSVTRSRWTSTALTSPIALRVLTLSPTGWAPASLRGGAPTCPAGLL